DRVGQNHQRRAFADGPESDVHAVGRLRVLDRRCVHQSLACQRTSYTRTGSSKPLATNSPRSAKRKPFPLHNPRTVSATKISPPSPSSESHLPVSIQRDWVALHHEDSEG